MENTKRLKGMERHVNLRCLSRSLFVVALSFYGAAALAQTTPELSCQLKVLSKSKTNSELSLTITNETNKAIKNWHLELTYPSTKPSQIVGVTNALQKGTNPALFNTLDNTTALAAHASYTFKALAIHEKSFVKPDITACARGKKPKQDADADGVVDSLDSCPNTGAGAVVDAQGCSAEQRDTDTDGINDLLDACPATPVGEAVDVAGCAASQLDDDSDSIVNALDSCPNTPIGEAVDVNGCSASQLDDDGDGINNAQDQCAGSLLDDGPVDSNGCSIFQRDGDKDGIFDVFDACPFTPIEFVSLQLIDFSGCVIMRDFEDDDGDKVLNLRDICPATPLGSTTNAQGCSAEQEIADSDGDGVPDLNDACPFSTPELPVDTFGCSINPDSDFDGLLNEEELLLGTDPNNFDSDFDGLGDGDEVKTIGTDPLNFDTDGGGNSDGQEIGQGTNPLDPSDDLLQLPVVLVDSAGFNWDIGFDGNINDGSGDAFDGGFRVEILGQNFNNVGAESAANGREVIINSTTFNNIVLTRRIFVPNHLPGARFIDTITNNSQIRQTLTLLRASNLGSDGSTSIVATSSGDAIFDPQDSFVVSDDFAGQMGIGDPVVSHIVQGQSVGQLAASLQSAQLDNDDVSSRYIVTLRPGESASFVSAGLQSDSGDEAIDHASAMANPNHAIWQGLNPVDILRIRNLFAEIDSDNDGLLDEQEALLGTDPLSADTNGDGRNDLESVLLEFNPALAGDSDNDGVVDFLDQCLMATNNEKDAQGCDVFVDPCIANPDACLPDADSDGFIDTQDLCPNEPGSLFTQGCPSIFGDSDNDGVPDTIDRCGFTPPATGVDFNGCSATELTTDDDQDGTVNANDLCFNTLIDPLDTASFIANIGCTLAQLDDNDQDGTANAFDLCPNEQGLTRLNGCPLVKGSGDADNDGITDNQDQCPSSPREFVLSFGVDINGCIFGDINSPFEDLDGDNIANLQDICPDSQGNPNVDGQGCTQEEQDSDLDGIINLFDSCPDTPRFSATSGNGCAEGQIPDSDNDGVTDELDQCPGTPFGVPVNAQGCQVFDLELLGARTITVASNGGVLFIPIRLSDLTFNGTLSPNAQIFFEFSPNVAAFESNRFPDGIEIIAFPDVAATELLLNIFVEDNGLRSNSIAVRVNIEQPNNLEHASVLINEGASIDASGINLIEAFNQLASEGQTGSGVSLFRQFWDAQRTQSAMGSNINCGPINGFPLVCDRLESEVVFLNDADLQAEMESYSTLAFVNRIELRDGWQNCGEHRIIFGRNNFNNPGRNLLIFEARVNNPTPGDIRGCENIIRSWEAMPNLSPIEQGIALRQLFIDGSNGSAPVIKLEHFSRGHGQIRTNQFISPEWLLREYDLAIDCEQGPCKVVANPVRVNENPAGELFNAFAAIGSDAFALKAAEFQNQFAANLEPLLKDDIIMLSNPVSEEFNNGQSHASFPGAIENDFNLHFGGDFGSPFGQALINQLQGKVDALGNPLSVQQILNRATAMTCGGCHEPANFGLLNPNSIGAFRLLDGSIIDSWPNTLGFVHVDENRNLSPALRQVFMPARMNAFEQVIDELNLATDLGIIEPQNSEEGPRINEIMFE